MENRFSFRILGVGKRAICDARTRGKSARALGRSGMVAYRFYRQTHLSNLRAQLQTLSALIRQICGLNENRRCRRVLPADNRLSKSPTLVVPQFLARPVLHSPPRKAYGISIALRRV